MDGAESVLQGSADSGISNRPIRWIVDKNGCHICTSHCRHSEKKKYPIIGRNGKIMRISRYLWERQFGEIPQGMEVCHKCDNPECINLEHLFIDTHQANVEDMVKKDRQAKGEKINCAKLSEKQVIEILKDPRKHIDIAVDYGVDASQISRIKNRKTWRHLHEK